jgi:Holliday junction resolvasome RuvABC endonuclease subunit
MLIAFDPGRHLGVAKAPLGESHRLVFETVKLKDTTEIGPFLRSADQHLQALLREATAVCIEKPNTQNQHHTGIFKNVALYGHVAYWCDMMGVPFNPVNAMHVKTALTGLGTAKKEQMIAGADALGFRGLDEHQADALGAWWTISFGVTESKTDYEKRMAGERRAAREAARAAKKP